MLTKRLNATRALVVVQGCDDVGSAVARELHVAGHAVVLVDDVDPPWPRRGMSYAAAWYVGGATLANVDACFCGSVRSIPAVLARGDMIAATTWSWQGVATALSVVALVVAGQPPQPSALQGFDGIVTVLDAAPDVAFAPSVVAQRGGRFSTRFEIAERVSAGELIGEIGNGAVIAPASGVLRGLAARGARVAAGQRVAEIDTHGDTQRCFGIDPRTRAIAQRAVAEVRGAMSIARGSDTAERAIEHVALA